MKKIIALVLVAVLAVCTLASCGAKPNSDPEAAKLALQNAGYFVEQSRIIMDADYFEGIVQAYRASGSRGVSNIELTICYFESNDAATKAWNNEEVKNFIKVEESGTWIPDTFVAKKVGNIIYFGDKEMVKDAK